MEEKEELRLNVLLKDFCSTNYLSRDEELFIRERLQSFTSITANPIDTTGKAYKLLVEQIKKKVPRAQNADAFNGGRINELFHRTKSEDKSGVKRWYKPELFDYLYEYIAICENTPDIRTRFHYLKHRPEIVLEYYQKEDLVKILGNDSEANELEELLRMAVSTPYEDTSAHSPQKPRHDTFLPVSDQESPIPGLVANARLQQRLGRAYLLAAFLGLSALAFAWLYFSKAPAQTDVLAPVNYEALLGDYIGTYSMVFRSKDTLQKLWTFPRLTLYRLKSQPENNKCFIVKMRGLYRKSEDEWAPDAINHIGVAWRYGDQFIQFELEPEKPEDKERYGKWFATVYLDGAILPEIAQSDVECYGTGGGISNYKEGKKGGALNNISTYTILFSNKPASDLKDDTVLSHMLEKIEIKAGLITSQPDSVKYQLLRTMFKGRKPSE